MARVAIFGFYKYGNFGDDLMAAIYARHVLSIGHTPVVYHLRPSLAEELGVDTEMALEDLLKNADYAIVGGGGLFTNAQPKPGSIFEEFRNDVYEFVRVAERKSIPYIVCSIGGGEVVSVHTPLHLAIARLITSPMLKGLSVRRERDRGILNECPAPGFVYQDVALCLGDYFPIGKVSRDESAPLRIGLSVYDRPSDRRLIRVLDLESRVRRGVSVCLLNAYSNESEHISEGVRGFSGTRRIEYAGLNSYLQELAGLDLVITCKLHIAVAALATGVPAVSFGGNAKAHSFYEDIKFEKALIPNLRAHRLMFLKSMVNAPALIKELRGSMPSLEHEIQSGRGHLGIVTEFLNAGSVSHCCK